jgi:prolyl-tRNA synthetase
VLALSGAEDLGVEAAEALSAAGKDVLLDDRAQRPGEKFADADLLGIPTRVTVGKKTLEDGMADVRDRVTGAEERVPIGQLGQED